MSFVPPNRVCATVSGTTRCTSTSFAAKKYENDQFLGNFRQTATEYVPNAFFGLRRLLADSEPYPGCTEELGSSVLVEVFVSVRTAEVLTRSRRVTFSEQLADVGECRNCVHSKFNCCCCCCCCCCFCCYCTVVVVCCCSCCFCCCCVVVVTVVVTVVTAAAIAVAFYSTQSLLRPTPGTSDSDIANFLLVRLLKIAISLSGGMIGLFSGMSFLSLAEIAYWMARLVFGRCLGKGKKRSGTSVTKVV